MQGQHGDYQHRPHPLDRSLELRLGSVNVTRRPELIITRLLSITTKTHAASRAGTKRQVLGSGASPRSTATMVSRRIAASQSAALAPTPRNGGILRIAWPSSVTLRVFQDVTGTQVFTPEGPNRRRVGHLQEAAQSSPRGRRTSR
jgi:hypothetical protein